MDIETFKHLPNTTKQSQKDITFLFRKEYEANPEFVELRTFVEENAFGFGEAEFFCLHKMILEDIPDYSMILEIGVFRGQTLALWRMISVMIGKPMKIRGVTPLDSTDGHWESDYVKDIKIIHDKFKLGNPTIIKGLSTDPEIINKCKGMELDVLYIDGGHTTEVVTSDILNYSPLVKKGGYMVIDDSANNISGAYDGKFWGIQNVSDVVDSMLPPKANNNDWEYIGNVIHNRVWKRI